MSEYLAFVRKIGTTLNGEYIYEFMFSTVPDVVWGENFNIVPAGIIPNIIPDKNTLSKKGRVITDIEFKLACESTCFSMQDCIDNIIALCFTEAGIENEFHFNFGEKKEDVIEKLEKYDLKLTDIEEIKIDDTDIIEGVVKELEGDDNEEDSDIDDIF